MISDYANECDVSPGKCSQTYQEYENSSTSPAMNEGTKDHEYTGRVYTESNYCGSGMDFFFLAPRGEEGEKSTRHMYNTNLLEEPSSRPIFDKFLEAANNPEKNYTINHKVHSDGSMRIIKVKESSEKDWTWVAVGLPRGLEFKRR